MSHTSSIILISDAVDTTSEQVQAQRRLSSMDRGKDAQVNGGMGHSSIDTTSRGIRRERPYIALPDVVCGEKVAEDDVGTFLS